MSYAFTVANTGNVKLRGLQLSVPVLGGDSSDSSISCSVSGLGSTWTAGSNLAADASLLCSGTYSFDQDAIEAGDLSPAINATATNLAAVVAAPLPAISVPLLPSLSVTVDTSTCNKPEHAGAHQHISCTCKPNLLCAMSAELWGTASWHGLCDRIAVAWLLDGVIVCSVPSEDLALSWLLFMLLQASCCHALLLCATTAVPRSATSLSLLLAGKVARQKIKRSCLT